MPIRVFPPHYQLVYISFDISSFSVISYIRTIFYLYFFSISMTVLRFAMFRKAIWAKLLTKMGDFADQFRPNYIQVGGVMLHEGLYTVTYVIVNGK